MGRDLTILDPIATDSTEVFTDMRQFRIPAVFRVFLAVFLVAGATTAHAQLPTDHWWAIASQLAPLSTPTDFTPHATQPGLVRPLLYSDSCASGCHAAGTGSPVSAPTYLPYATWAGSMMANATRDPLFWAALDIANNDAPGVGDYCLRCHTPAGWYEGNVVKTAFNLPPPNDPVKGAAGCLLKGAYNAPDNGNSDFGGVTCHFCHRLLAQGPNAEPPYFENADAWLDDQQCNGFGGPCRRGPYTYPSGAYQPGAPAPPNAPHEWAQSAYHTQSAICGLCHNVSSPDTTSGPVHTLKLNDGTDTGHSFPMQRTFDEWQQSSYASAGGQTCQNCHMPTSEDPAATACMIPGYPSRTGDLPVHEFAGGNTWVPGIIKGEYNAGISSGGTDRTAAFDQTAQWARALLRTAASLHAVIQNYTPPSGGNAGSMSVQVAVTNLSGHKLPTGYAEGRRMWLNLQVRDANGGLVFESAAYAAATGVLTADPQARIYEILQGIWNQHGTSQCDIEDGAGVPMFHSALNDCIAKDNRIPPLGFRPATAADPNGYDTRPVGANYPETSPGSGVLVNYDTANYALGVPVGTVGPLTVTARLYDQTSSKDYMEFLRDQALQNNFQAENLMCSGSPNRPFSVGPQGLARGQFAYNLWHNPTALERIFADGFDGTRPATGYGKSPPELMQVVTASRVP